MEKIKTMMLKNGFRAGTVSLLILASFLVVHGLLNWLANGTKMVEWVLGLIICLACILLGSAAAKTGKT